MASEVCNFRLRAEFIVFSLSKNRPALQFELFSSHSAFFCELLDFCFLLSDCCETSCQTNKYDTNIITSLWVC